MNYLFIFMLVSFLSFSQSKGVLPISTTPSSSTSQSYAVVVGISDYQDPGIPDLRFADKDAEAFANFLRSDAGGKLDKDHLKILINAQATMAQFGIALDWLMENAKENDKVLIYFSGHGDVEKKTITQPGFLLCWDAPSKVYISGGAFALPMLQEVISTLSIQNKSKVIVITDACRSGKLAGSSVGGSQATASNLAKQYANEIKIMSCQPNEYSIEGEQWGGGRGAFSYHLIDAFYGMSDSDQDQIITLYEIGRYLEDHVSSEVAPIYQMPLIIGNRNEKMAGVNVELLAAIKSGKTNQQMMLTTIESKGIEEDVLASLDTSLRKTYNLFKQALNDKMFLEPIERCADYYFDQLIKEVKFEKLHSTMRRNYAAALQDDAQQVLNVLLKTGITEEVRSGISPEELYKNYPAYLERAAELLGKNHYMYAPLQARKNYFEGCIHENNSERKQYFQRALQWQPNLPHAYAMLIYYSEQTDSADYFAKKAMELAPSWVLPYTDLASYYLRKLKDYNKAESLLNQAGEVDSNSVYVWYQKARFYHFIKKLDVSNHWYNKVISSSITEGVCFPCALQGLSMLYLSMDQMKDAEPLLLKAIEMDSSKLTLYNTLGIIYNVTGQLDKAERMFNTAIARGDDIAPNRNELGNVYWAKGRKSDAEQEYRKAINMDSSFLNAQLNLGMVLNEAKRYQEAEQLYLLVVRRNPTEIEGYTNLAWVYTYTHRKPEAITFFEKAIALDSTNAYTFYQYGSSMSFFKQEDLGFEKLERAFLLKFNDLKMMEQDIDMDFLRSRVDRMNALMKKYFPEKK